MKTNPRCLFRVLLPGLLLVPLWACDDLGPSGPRGAGFLQVELVSPHGGEGSAVFEVFGGTGLGPVTSLDGEVYFHHGADATRVVIVLDAPGRIGFRVQTNDVRVLPSVTVVQVADGSDQLRTSLSGYEVVLSRPDDGGSE